MTKQEIYDKVCAHLAQQKTRSTNGSTCAYRGCKGKMCAVGCLIPDDLYSPAMDPYGGIDAAELLGRYPSVRALLGAENRSLLMALQIAHDESKDPDALRYSLIEAADEHHLTPGAEQAITEWS